MAFCPFFVYRDCPANSECALYSNGCPFLFGGNVYSKTMTMANDNPTRFETSAKRIRGASVIVETNAMLIGETGVEVYPLGVNDTKEFSQIDISTLYFKNAVGGSNGKITIIGVEE